MDISDTLEPNSDQLDAIELIAPRTFTIEKVTRGSADQPVNIHLAGFPRPWRPGKSMRRVLVAVWGPNAAEYVGRRVTLYNDTSVRFGGIEVGGVRISHMSHLDKPKTITLLIARGKSAPFVVQPLTEPDPSGLDVFTPITKERLTELDKVFNAVEISDKRERLDFAAATIGREIGSATELSEDEGAQLVAALVKLSDDKADDVNAELTLDGAEGDGWGS